MVEEYSRPKGLNDLVELLENIKRTKRGLRWRFKGISLHLTADVS